MKILVTGGSGFIGSHLCDRLVSEGHEVWTMDNNQTGENKNSDTWVVRHDVTCQYPAWLEPFDRVYNLACPASPVHYQDDPIQTWKTSVLGSYHLLEFISNVSPEARVLQASTSEVYGDPLVHPQSEEYWGNVNPHGIRACYDEGKRAAEAVFFDYHRERNVDIRVARIFNTYGPRMSIDDGRVVSNFMVQALKGDDITVYGDGSQTRSFCYVDDMIEGLVRLMESDTVGPVNLGNPNEFTILELARVVREMTDFRSNIVMRPLPGDDPRQRKPDITLAQQRLGWSPQVQLEDGLSMTMRYFEKALVKNDEEC